jgi:hypothetical protein
MRISPSKPKRESREDPVREAFQKGIAQNLAYNDLLVDAIAELTRWSGHYME